MQIRRRDTLKSFVFYPLVLCFSKIESFAQNLFSSTSAAQASSSPADDYEQRYVAVRVLRLLNTVEMRNSLEKDDGKFLELPELRNSTAMQSLLQDEEADRRGIGKSLYEQLQFDQEEILPGWHFAFTTTNQKAGYLIRMQNPTLGRSLSTDQVGIIFEGRPLDHDARLDEANRAEDIIASASGLKSHEHFPVSRFSAITRAVAFASSSAFCTFCRQFPCSCGVCCACMSVPQGFACANCGCPSCIWCCC